MTDKKPFEHVDVGPLFGGDPEARFAVVYRQRPGLDLRKTLTRTREAAQRWKEQREAEGCVDVEIVERS